MIRLGNSFLIPSGETLHLFVVVHIQSDGMCILIPICSIRQGRYYDPTCVIRAEDRLHPFIKNDSYVAYNHALLRAGSHIEKCVREKSFIEKSDIPGELHNQILVGTLRSIHSPRWVKSIIKNISQ